MKKLQNSYFLHWNFDEKSCFVVFFHEWNEWKNPQFNFSSQNLSIECNFFKWDGKETKISHPLFHRIRKKIFFNKFLEMLIFVKTMILFEKNWNSTILLYICRSNAQSLKSFFFFTKDFQFYRRQINLLLSSNSKNPIL